MLIRLHTPGCQPRHPEAPGVAGPRRMKRPGCCTLAAPAGPSTLRGSPTAVGSHLRVTEWHDTSSVRCRAWEGCGDGVWQRIACMTEGGSSRAAAAGIALMIAGIFLFAVNDTLGKWLVATYSVGQVLLVRSL